MKKLSILAILLLVLAPASAMAGMTAASDMDLADVSGQTGITISMSMTVSATGFAWGDDDGFVGYADDGWVILSNLSLPTIALSGVTIDAGTNAGVSRVQIGTGGPIITGDMTIGAVIIGTGPTSIGPSLGEIRVTGISIGFGDILIGGH
ncbi:MAG: hypothetical protein QMD09_09575 [Desulfatibacillaceae bacterium]|nr:hypothetical protein [Desulfatibacillaceae bacterium]